MNILYRSSLDESILEGFAKVYLFYWKLFAFTKQIRRLVINLSKLISNTFLSIRYIQSQASRNFVKCHDAVAKKYITKLFQ